MQGVFMRQLFRLIALLVLAAVMISAPVAHAQKTPVIAVVTPYLAQPGTQFMVEGFQAYGKEKGWTVNVIDTAGDTAAAISRLEDVVSQKVDVIVINADVSQIAAGLDAAKKAGIPVVGLDSGSDPLLVANVTSNGYAMASETASYVVDSLNGKGNVVMFTFDAYPPVQKRGIIADAIFANNPDIKIVSRVTPDVKDGGIADSRAKMEALLAANPDPGSISAVWAAWDQPALGALQAIEAAGRQKEGIVIVGIDANPQALDAIAAKGNFKASVAQDFNGMGRAAGDIVQTLLNKGEITQRTVYVPTKFVTAENVKDFLKK
jgi:ribose transport system substrate-binding protein